MRAVALSLLLLLAPLLAGCLGGEDGGDPITDADTNQSGVGNLTLPDGRDGDFAAFKETNQTDDYGHHGHDLWNGRTRVEVVNMEVEMTPGYGNGRSTKEVRLPSGSLIYEGTGKVEILLSNPRRHVCEDQLTWNGDFICTSHTQTAPVSGSEPEPIEDPGMAGAMNVKFIHAASNLGDWIDAGQAQWAAPLEVKVVAATWTDMPHSSGSLWAFLIEGPSDMDDTLVFDLTISIIKAAEPPQWPGHPVFYDEDTHYREVMDARGRVSNFGTPSDDTQTNPDKLISAGTKTILVFANITSVTGKPLEPTHYYLFFHNASFQNWNLTSPFSEEHTADRTSLMWILRMDVNGMDGPYATQSRWEFVVRGAHTTPAVSCYNGCFDYDLEYNIEVIATDLEVPDEAYHATRPG